MIREPVLMDPTPEYDKQDPHILTYTGHRFPLMRATRDDLRIEDIAHALSQTCRYGGHCPDFYSVAQHSDIVRGLLLRDKAPVTTQMWGLLHDAIEAYCSDIPGPLKVRTHILDNEGMLYPVREWEHGILHTLAEKFDLPWPVPQEVWDADQEALQMEYKSFFGRERTMPCWQPPDAKRVFLDSYHRLMDQLREDS